LLGGKDSTGRWLLSPSIVAQDRADAAVLREQRIAAITEQVQVERLISLLLAVALDFDRDGLRRLAGGEGQRAGLGNVVAIVRRCGTVTSDDTRSCCSTQSCFISNRSD
jgi:hypothetical protein